MNERTAGSSGERFCRIQDGENAEKPSTGGSIGILPSTGVPSERRGGFIGKK